MSSTNGSNQISRRGFLQSCASTLLTSLLLTHLPKQVAASTTGETDQPQAFGYGDGLYNDGSYPATDMNTNTTTVFMPFITKE